MPHDDHTAPHDDGPQDPGAQHGGVQHAAPKRPPDLLAENADLTPEEVPAAGTSLLGPDTLTLVAVGVGGALGSLARYGVGLARPTPGDGFPLATWMINVSGSLLLGFLLTVLTERRRPNRYARPFLATGFTGGYTTWSTFMVDADQLLRHHHPLTALGYVAATLGGGLAAVALGVWVTRRLPRSRLTPLTPAPLGGAS